ncbi:MAG: hypothetical protein KAQ71_00335, partial [Desulfobulbaceae bacterium]|nr:hypothetical protein [Desulfobulbaceae bacterium]
QIETLGILPEQFWGISPFVVRRCAQKITAILQCGMPVGMFSNGPQKKYPVITTPFCNRG